MSHVLLLEVPGGNDFTILQEAVRLGHRVTFFTADRDFYRAVGEDAVAALDLAQEVVEVRPFTYEAFEREVLVRHGTTPFDAVLCLIDIRLIEASRIARRLGLPFLDPETARLVRDKYGVRDHLARRGIRQPRFALATSNDGIFEALEEIGFPALIKPSDGYGSQNIVSFRSRDEVGQVRDLLATFLPCRIDYGFGVQSNDRLVVEQLVEGTVVGVDTLTCRGRHTVLGINEKEFFAPPSYAIRGSCFPSGRFDDRVIEAYVVEILDALGFDHGASHTELVVDSDGLPYLIEVNPRLVGAQIALLVGLALERSVYADLVQLHLGVAPPTNVAASRVAVVRWLTAPEIGVIEAIELPEPRDARIKAVRIFKRPGAHVGPPFENGDRLGYVMVAAEGREEAERVAEAFVSATRLTIAPLNG